MATVTTAVFTLCLFGVGTELCVLDRLPLAGSGTQK
jgi:hypothetical protein